jgi:hypothetical protein
LVGIVGVGAFSVEGGWVMLFLLLPAFFTWLGPMDAGGWLVVDAAAAIADD